MPLLSPDTKGYLERKHLREHPGVDPANDPAIAGGIILSVNLADDQRARDVRAALEELGGEDIAAE
jgi:hypothetical protein